MRKIKRIPLAAATAKNLKTRQKNADAKARGGTLDIEAEWKGARQTKPLKTVLAKLKEMAGKRERCMYCEDSHGTDIEHFWPKNPYSGQMFQWLNHLLCCTECGRFKGNQFPVDAAGHPVLVNPTAENPWDHLDFDPMTGNIVAAFDKAANDWSKRGEKTVEMLHLDEREAMAEGYKKTFGRLKRLFESAVAQDQVDSAEFLGALIHADDHGLLGWCFTGTGQNIAPFKDLKSCHSATWASCLTAIA